MNFQIDNSDVLMTLEKGDYINQTFESFSEIIKLKESHRYNKVIKAVPILGTE